MRGIVVQGALGATRAHSCERPIAPQGRVVLDLRRMSWCDPVGLVMVAALAERASAQGWATELYRPSDTNVANYLGRMRLGLAMNELGVEHDLPEVRERPLETSLVELALLTDEDDCDRAAALVRDATAARCGDLVADRLYETLIEAVQNVVHHSCASRGFVTAQVFPTKKVVRFAVADAGIGLRKSLSIRGAWDDGAAINLALAGTSRLDERGRGHGFPTMREVTASAGGRIEVISGLARYNGHRVIRSREEAFDGTLIQGTLGFAD